MENYSRDAVSFDDLVLSSVHVESEHQRRILDQNFLVTKFKFDVVDQSLSNREQYVGLCYDEEGDIIVHRGNNHVIKEEEIMIYHCMATPLADVGKQLWLGALLLGDWILHNPSLFKEAHCLELGAGTGLCSMLAGIYCKHIFCTDTGDSVLELCQKNVDENENLLKYGKTGIKVKELNWMYDNFSHSKDNDKCRKFDWTSDEISELKKTEIFLAADELISQSMNWMYRALHTITSGRCLVFLSLADFQVLHGSIVYKELI
ncbi:methyltransferase-like protein 22 isoform X2 [Rhopilema esculentum]|uniref:methyltransferase-like protein 22 isoform X2 n=1 Tax=Rhopilema esculentum TaxID=499914 RepID=UPI0031D54E3E